MAEEIDPLKQGLKPSLHIGTVACISAEEIDPLKNNWRDNLREKYRKLFSKMEQRRINSSDP